MRESPPPRARVRGQTPRLDSFACGQEERRAGRHAAGSKPKYAQKPLGDASVRGSQGAGQAKASVDVRVEATVVERSLRPPEEHGEVARIPPVRAPVHFVLDSRVEAGAGKRIRDGNADVVRERLIDEIQCRLHVARGLARVAELKEEAHLHSCGAQP